MKFLRPCMVVTGALLFACCAVYPALVTGVAQAAFPHEANGSLIVHGGRARGSSLLGQTLADPSAHPAYFWGRPSGASVDSATGVTGPIPVDLVTKSASGLDPHLSPAAVAVQIPRVARARAMSEEALRARVATHTDAPTMGLLGEARVNVLELNLALDAEARGEQHR